jgi:Tol biopolymer transport system component/tRNA A-37 threonylcarbamoyl transferase component Bud32
MALSPGSRVGTYEVIAPIGRGGMGEVYRARDLKLHREVAIKALPELFLQDRDRLARFEREARMLASLNHPNIAAIYGLEDQGGTKFLVLELVEGQTLAERLAAGPLPVDEALSVGSQIASALEAAHGAGIIHRDLKPANVKIRPDGSVKVLDLGLARAVDPGTDRVDSSLSPTMTTPATLAGSILGTAAYMSPEQARGKPLDKRTDIFSFACVLYECLTGRQAFSGETVSDTISAILRSEPDASALPPETSWRIRDLLRRCFQKDLKRRLHDIADARIEIEEAQAGGSGESPSGVAAAAPAPWRKLLWGIGGALAGAALVAAVSRLGRPAPRVEPPAVHAVLPLPPGERLWTQKQSLALSPDGRTVVFTAVRDRAVSLFRRPLGGTAAEPIQGSEDASRPFFSPDGQWVGFMVRNELRKVPLAGGTAVLVGHFPPATAAASWGTDGRIVATFGVNTGLYAVSDAGGLAQPLTKLDASRGEHAHLYPQTLPGGRSILFTLRLGKDHTDVEKSSIAVLDAAGGKWRTVLEGASFARYGDGRLVFVRGPSVFSAPFDLSRLAVTGAAVAMAENIAVDLDEGAAQLALSNDGTLAYVDGPAIRTVTTVLRLDRAGKESVLPLPAAGYSSPRLSPDGKRLAVAQRIGSRRSIVVYDRERGVLSSLTPEPGEFMTPFWSPDGKRIAFSRLAASVPQLSVRSADGTGEIEVLTGSTGNAEFANSWSPDGKTILYATMYARDQGPMRPMLTSDIWLFRMERDAPARPWFESPFREAGAALSPDGKWVAYVSDESGSPEIYVRPFPGPGAAVKVSTESGSEPVWSREGRELLFRVGGRHPKFMSVEVRTTPALQVSAPRLLFASDLNAGGPGVRTNEFREYDVSRDGNEIIALRTVAVEEPSQLAIVTRWAAAKGP